MLLAPVDTSGIMVVAMASLSLTLSLSLSLDQMHAHLRIRGACISDRNAGAAIPHRTARLAPLSHFLSLDRPIPLSLSSPPPCNARAPSDPKCRAYISDRNA